jgi:hypothetical protein
MEGDGWGMMIPLQPYLWLLYQLAWAEGDGEPVVPAAIRRDQLAPVPLRLEQIGHPRARRSGRRQHRLAIAPGFLGLRRLVQEAHHFRLAGAEVERSAGNDHLLVVADDLERVSVDPRQRRPLLPLEAVPLVAADDQVVEAPLDAVLGPEDDEILALRCIERVDECGLIAEQPVGT